MRVTLTGGVNAVISGLFFDVSNGSGDGGLPPGTVATIYAYDILNHLTSVSMPRGFTTQTRTFNYTSGTTVGINLLSATNPENGTVTYTYNSDNTIHTKTDAKGQVITYAYDGYKRVTQISVGSTSLRTFMYDTNTLDGTSRDRTPKAAWSPSKMPNSTRPAQAPSPRSSSLKCMHTPRPARQAGSACSPTKPSPAELSKLSTWTPPTPTTARVK
jgi:YD repeat-containing protein